MRSRHVAALVCVVVASVLLALAAVDVRRSPPSDRGSADRSAAPSLPDECRAQVAGRRVVLRPRPARDAARIVAVSIKRRLPQRAATIALTAAYDSTLTNPREREAFGMRMPSWRWESTNARPLDSYAAVSAFYDRLATIRYRRVPVPTAVQRVQPAPTRAVYAARVPDARVLATALTGRARRAFSCRLALDERPRPRSLRLNPAGLTARADRVRYDLKFYFDPPFGGYAPRGVRTGHIPGSAHYEGRAVDAFVRPINRRNNRTGWAMAQYLVANALRLDVATVIFDRRIWTWERSAQGWRPYETPDRPGNRAILEHRDHVHVDVFR